MVKVLVTQFSQPEFGPMRNSRNRKVLTSSTRRKHRTNVRGPLPLTCVLLLSLSHTSKLFFRKNKRCHATEVVYPSWTTQKKYAHQDMQIRNVGFGLGRVRLSSPGSIAGITERAAVDQGHPFLLPLNVYPRLGNPSGPHVDSQLPLLPPACAR